MRKHCFRINLPRSHAVRPTNKIFQLPGNISIKVECVLPDGVAFSEDKSTNSKFILAPEQGGLLFPPASIIVIVPENQGENSIKVDYIGKALSALNNFLYAYESVTSDPNLRPVSRTWLNQGNYQYVIVESDSSQKPQAVNRSILNYVQKPLAKTEEKLIEARLTSGGHPIEMFKALARRALDEENISTAIVFAAASFEAHLLALFYENADYVYQHVSDLLYSSRDLKKSEKSAVRRVLRNGEPDYLGLVQNKMMVKPPLNAEEAVKAFLDSKPTVQAQLRVLVRASKLNEKDLVQKQIQAYKSRNSIAHGRRLPNEEDKDNVKWLLKTPEQIEDRFDHLKGFKSNLVTGECPKCHGPVKKPSARGGICQPSRRDLKYGPIEGIYTCQNCVKNFTVLYELRNNVVTEIDRWASDD